MSTRSRAFVPWLAGVALATLAVGCDGCTKAGQLRVDGDFPYVRCLAVDEREAAEWSVGDLRLRSEGRVLTIEGIEPPLRMAAFVGPGPGSADPHGALGALGPHGAKLVWVLGELGDSEAHAQRTLAALAAYPGVSLVLASGRDDFDVLEEAWDSLSDEAAAHVIDLRPFRAVRVGSHRLRSDLRRGRGALRPQPLLLWLWRGRPRGGRGRAAGRRGGAALHGVLGRARRWGGPRRGRHRRRRSGPGRVHDRQRHRRRPVRLAPARVPGRAAGWAPIA
jgi:hypothetical protein